MEEPSSQWALSSECSALQWGLSEEAWSPGLDHFPSVDMVSRRSDFFPLLLWRHFLPPWCSSALSGKKS